MSLVIIASSRDTPLITWQGGGGVVVEMVTSPRSGPKFFLLYPPFPRDINPSVPLCVSV